MSCVSARYLRSTFLGLALLPGACGAAGAQESATVSPVPKAVYDSSKVEGDFAQLEAQKSDSLFSYSDRAKAEFPKTPIPLFVPGELLDSQAAGSAKSSDDPADDAGGAACGEGRSYIAHDDGYLAACSFEAFDFVIEGTSRVFGTDTSKAASSAAELSYVMPFSESETGGSIAFGYAGAHYVAYFECREGGSDCVNEVSAQALASRLVLCALGGKCVENGTALIQR